MEILNWPGPPPAARGYWRRGSADATLTAMRQDFEAGRLAPALYDLAFGSLPFLALEDAFAASETLRLDDALSAPRFTATLDRVAGSPEHQHQYKVHAMELWFRLAYERAGSHDYEVAPGLAQRLRHTELRGLTTDDLHLPHPCLLIRVPLEAALTLPDSDGSSLPVTGMLLAEEPEPGRCWRICVEARRPDGARTLNLFSVGLSEGRMLEDALTEHAAKTGEAPHGDWRALWDWAMNVALYSASGGVREEVWHNREARQLRERMEKLPKGEKRDKLRAKLKGMDPQRRIILGRGVPPVERPPESAGTGHPLVVRVRVSGHWKRQAHGTERRERKLIWVQPYWRGPDDGTAPVTTTHEIR
ncbi:hypothetical protein [Myxococcus sp. AS-1-15]|jgi:hypothetical protein|uniref:hypothetical protein n=1 Tax=Myxococcus sp. AS-1-15 TaxID=2874600 RepID=UPI001CC1BCC9|nr:hypothetical protein [Myxococcus sp. AS-1-15]MBZ4398643.1 hypothetical protein [Myxococcus sp. AS-1-15]